MAKIAQFHYWASPGDAITNQMRFLHGELVAQGYSSTVLAVQKKGDIPAIHSWHPNQLSPEDIFIIHHSQGTPNLEELLKVKARKMLVYHNITPPEFFKHDPKLASLCALGRLQLKSAIRECDVLFADSLFNSEELKELGGRDITLLPLFHLENLTSQWMELKNKRPKILFVGRLCPHKDQALLIAVAKELHSGGFDFEMNLVGRGDLLYTKYLNLLIRHASLSRNVYIRGSVSDEKLRDYYAGADAFVCVSKHEGFCIPVIEAMKHSVPVFSTTDAALTETLGSAGVQFGTRDPQKIATCLKSALTTPAYLRKIRESGHKRLSELAPFQNRKHALSVLLSRISNSSEFKVGVT